MDGFERRWRGAALEPGRQGTVLLLRSDAHGRAGQRASRRSRTVRQSALFDAPVQAGYTNDSHRWQVAPDGKRFLLLTNAGKDQAPPLDVIVNWSALLKR